MKQCRFDFVAEIVLTPFEKATAEQLVSYKIGKKDKETDKQVKARIKAAINSDKLKFEVIKMVLRWNKDRVKLGLKPFK